VTSNKQDLNILILAAGKGSRLKSKTPKIFLKLKSKTLLEHSISFAKKLNPKDIFVITNPKYKYLDKIYNCKFLFQKKPLGTGHAVKIFLKKNHSAKKLLILYADTPLISLNAAKKVVKKLNYSDVVLTTFRSKKNLSMGLVKINSKKKITSIIEYKNANSKDKKIDLCNSGMMGINQTNYKNIFKIKRNKITKEYYLTDIVKISYEKNLLINKISIKNNLASRGINTIEEFNNLKK
tara:strand:+ start:2131 stop:2841 length:711 start_codon:yes stop_codon:yes gene_type:complete